MAFMGGGAILLRRQIEISGKAGNAIFVEDINANAKGYELLYRIEASGRRAYGQEESRGTILHKIQ